MQAEKARKDAMMEELKHYINGKFKEMEDKLLKAEKAEKAEKPAKVTREKATRG